MSIVRTETMLEVSAFRDGGSNFRTAAVPERKLNPYVAYIPTGEDQNLAMEVSSWIQGEVDNGGTMLPKTPGDILGLFKDSRSVVLIDVKTLKPAGHMAFTEEYPDGSLEVGAVVVNKEFRGNGAADEMMSQLLKLGEKTIPDFSKRKILALANEASYKMFLRTGYRDAEREELHEDVWKLCENCPRKSENGLCCDVPVTLVKQPSLYE